MIKRSSLGFNSPVYRPLWQLIVVVLIAFLIGTSLLVFSAWRSVHRMKPIHHHLEFLAELQEMDLKLQEFINNPEQRNQFIRSDVTRILGKLIDPPVSQHALVSSTRTRLQSIKLELSRESLDSPKMAENVRNGIREINAQETIAHNTLLNDIDYDIRFELFLSLIVWLLLTASLSIFAYLLRKRFLSPLDNLSKFMTALGEGTYRTVSTEGADMVLQPLFSNYNQMVTRLVELEKEHQTRHQFLEEKIHEATRMLLEQHMTLARAERLAVVGEFSATLAHELRNPLAGIQMALLNLLNEVKSENFRERIKLVNDELSRVSGILNFVLDQSRHEPEQASEFDANELIGNIINLLKFQLPTGIKIHLSGAGKCCLPVDGLRQAMINIIINAAQAIGEEAGSIEIHLLQMEEKLRIQICDSGPGFPEQLLNQPMQSFNSWKEKGTGLGLAMVRRFVRNVSGELKLENRERGACVLLTLPCYVSGSKSND